MKKNIIPISTYTDSSGLKIKSIWPDKTILSEPSISENNKSEVLLVEFEGQKILLCGDIEKTAQNQLIKQNPDLTVDIVVLPHHGSLTNLDIGFIESLKPSVVIASCSRRTLGNSYHPSENASIQTFYTAKDGAVTIKIDNKGSLNASCYINSVSDKQSL